MGSGKKVGLKSLTLAVLVCGAGSTWCNAETISLNVDPSTLSDLDSQFTARYRFDTTGGVDQMLFRLPSPAGYPSADLIRMGSPYVGSVTYLFTLTSDGADGYTFALTDGTRTGGASFASASSANRTLSKSFTGNDAIDGYNVLHIYAVADKDARVSFSDLSFTSLSPGLTTSGSLQDALTLNSTGSVVTYDQWLAAPTGTDLGDYQWTLSGLVTLALDGQKPSAERIKFEVTGTAGTYTAAVPEPSSMAMATIALGAGGLVALRRRNRSSC